MKDFISNGTGNSRYMKSNIPASTTLPQLIAMMNAGTFPFDLNGVNTAGVAQEGTALSKANLLPDAVCTALGISTNSVPKDALSALYNFANTKAQMQIVSYRGTGTYLTNHTAITFDFAPDLILYLSGLHTTNCSFSYSSIMIYAQDWSTEFVQNRAINANNVNYMYSKRSEDGKTFSWYNQNGAQAQLNVSGVSYYFLGIKI